MKNETKINQLDYKEIQELSRRVDHTITEADFNTTHPNPLRIDYIISDIHRYLKCAGGKYNAVEY